MPNRLTCSILAVVCSSLSLMPADISMPDGIGCRAPFTTYDCDDRAVFTYGGNTRAIDNYHELTRESYNKKCVSLAATGDYVEFTARGPANTLLVRYSLPFFTARNLVRTLSLSVNGSTVSSLQLSSHYLHSQQGDDNQYAPAPSDLPVEQVMRWWEEACVTGLSIGAGDRIRISKNASDLSPEYYLDLVDLELAPPARGNAGSKPDNTWISVTEHGAIADDTSDDYTAIVAAIGAAMGGARKVWFPPGRFDVLRTINLTPAQSGLTIEGAGMWHSELFLATSVVESPTVHHLFYVTGNQLTVRNLRLNGIPNLRRLSVGGVRNNTGHHFLQVDAARKLTLDSLWTIHLASPAWMLGDSNTVTNCRSRSSYADGYHIEDGASDCLVRNNHVRGHGDDGLAIITHTVNGARNRIVNNTVDCGYFGRGVCIRGGTDNALENNLVRFSKTPWGLWLCPYDKGEISPVENLVVRNNFFVDCGYTDAVLIDPRGAAFTAQLSGNVVYNSLGANGIRCAGDFSLATVAVDSNTLFCTGACFSNTGVAGVTLTANQCNPAVAAREHEPPHGTARRHGCGQPFAYTIAGRQLSPGALPVHRGLILSLRGSARVWVQLNHSTVVR